MLLSFALLPTAIILAVGVLILFAVLRSRSKAKGPVVTRGAHASPPTTSSWAWTYRWVPVLVKGTGKYILLPVGKWVLGILKFPLKLLLVLGACVLAGWIIEIKLPEWTSGRAVEAQARYGDGVPQARIKMKPEPQDSSLPRGCTRITFYDNMNLEGRGCVVINVPMGKSVMITPRAYTEVMPFSQLEKVAVTYYYQDNFVGSMVHEAGVPEPCFRGKASSVKVAPISQPGLLAGDIIVTIAGERRATC